MKPLLFFLIFPFFLHSCGNSKGNELTYREIYLKVIQEGGQRIEWHGEALNQEAIDVLTISRSGNCGTEDCGEKVFLKNESDKKVSVVIQAPFQIEDYSSHLATKYTVKANSQIALGCSHLCLEDQQYLFERRIVGAEYVDK